MTSTPPASAVADVLALRGLDGWLTPPLVPVVAPSEPRRATARTMRVEAADQGPGLVALYELLDHDLDGCALVIAGAADIAGAVWGEILSRAAGRAGASAILVDGAVRDRAAMAAEGVAVFARGEVVVGPNGRAHVVVVDEPVEIDGVLVHSGDTIVIDGSGVVRLVADQAAEILAAAATYAAAEDQLLAALAAGEPLSTAYRIKRQVVQELHETTRGR